MGEVAAAQVGRRIGFFPGDVVEDFEAELLHGVADAEDDVVRAGDPDGAVGFQDALAAFEPFGVEFVHHFHRASAFTRPKGFGERVPVAFVDFDHFAGVTGDAAVGEEVGRVGEDHVKTAVGVFGGDGIHHFEAVALVEEDAVRVVTIHTVLCARKLPEFHDDAVQRIQALGGNGVASGGRTRNNGRRAALPYKFLVFSPVSPQADQIHRIGDQIKIHLPSLGLRQTGLGGEPTP